MIPAALAAVATAPRERPASWETLLDSSVREEFAVAVYRARPGDRVLFGHPCAVGPCVAAGLQGFAALDGHLCATHARAWRTAQEPPVVAWAAAAPALRSLRVAQGCQARSCSRSVVANGLCASHSRAWTVAVVHRSRHSRGPRRLPERARRSARSPTARFRRPASMSSATPTSPACASGG